VETEAYSLPECVLYFGFFSFLSYEKGIIIWLALVEWI